MERVLDSSLPKWCELHFIQTKGAPFSSPTHRKIFDTIVENNLIEDTLHILCPDLEVERVEIQDLVESMQYPDEISPTDVILTFEQFTKFINKQQESTMSSLSDRHYGNLKTCRQDPSILRVIFDIMDLVFRNNVPLDRWVVAHDLLLWKYKESCKMYRWRSITLVEGDLKYTLKEIWARRLLTLAGPLINTLQNTRKTGWFKLPF